MLELAQNVLDVMLLGFGVLMRNIANMENQIRLHHLLKRRAKRSDKLGRQIGYESDGVRQHGLTAVRQRQRAQRRVEGREQHVRSLHVSARHPIEQRRFAGIGIADQRNHAIRHALPAGAMQPPCRLHLLEFVFHAA